MIDGKTYWYTGDLVSLCSCRHEPLPVWTDGKEDYAYCPVCRHTWKVTKEEWKDAE